MALFLNMSLHPCRVPQVLGVGMCLSVMVTGYVPKCHGDRFI